MKAKRSYATLTILSSTLSVQELEQMIAVSPDRTREKGDLRGREPNNVYPYSVVAFESHIDQTADPAAHVDDLLDRVSSAKDAIRHLSGATLSDDVRRFPVRFSLHLESTQGEIGFDFSSEQLKSMIELGARLGIDVECDCEPSDKTE